MNWFNIVAVFSYHHLKCAKLIKRFLEAEINEMRDDTYTIQFIDAQNNFSPASHRQATLRGIGMFSVPERFLLFFVIIGVSTTLEEQLKASLSLLCLYCCCYCLFVVSSRKVDRRIIINSVFYYGYKSIYFLSVSLTTKRTRSRSGHSIIKARGYSPPDPTRLYSFNRPVLDCNWIN